MSSLQLADCRTYLVLAAWHGCARTGRMTSPVTSHDFYLAPLRLCVRFFVRGSPAKDQHPVTEMESLTQEDKDRGEERNRGWPNCQPKEGLRTVNSLH
jgi:hypothetical protein